MRETDEMGAVHGAGCQRTGCTLRSPCMYEYPEVFCSTTIQVSCTSLTTKRPHPQTTRIYPLPSPHPLASPTSHPLLNQLCPHIHKSTPSQNEPKSNNQMKKPVVSLSNKRRSLAFLCPLSKTTICVGKEGRPDRMFSSSFCSNIGKISRRVCMICMVWTKSKRALNSLTRQTPIFRVFPVGKRGVSKKMEKALPMQRGLAARRSTQRS